MCSYSEEAKAIHGAPFGEGEGPVLLDEVRCTGEESYLLECGHAPWGQTDCNHNEDVGVICSQRENIDLSVIYILHTYTLFLLPPSNSLSPMHAHTHTHTHLSLIHI